MRYELSAECGTTGWPALLRERRGRRHPGDHYAEADDPGGTHPVTRAAERRVRGRGDGRERFRRLLALSEFLANALPETTRNAWLELEEALHEHWLEVAIEHYNLGVDAGLVREAAPPPPPRRLPARERAHALAEALRAALEEL
jgi:hypothetical protein